MGWVGLSSTEALRFISNDSPLVENVKFENEFLSNLAGVVAGVAAGALSTFLIIRFVLNPNMKFKVNPDYNPDSRFGVNSSEYIPENFGVASIAAGLLPLSIILLPLAIGALVRKGILAKLTWWRMKPIQDLQDQIRSLDGTAPILNHDLLISVIRRVGDISKRELLVRMNFNQLMVAKNALGDKKFLNLIRTSNQKECVKWRRIIQFSKLDHVSMKKALSRGEGGYAFLHHMIQKLPVERQQIISIIQKQKDLEVKRELMEQVNEILGIKGGRDKPTVLLEMGEKKYSYSEDWIRAHCHTLRDVMDNVDLIDGKKVIPMPSNNPFVPVDQMLKALKVLAHEVPMPKSFSEMQDLALAANYLGMDHLLLMMGSNVLEKAQLNQISKMELLHFFHAKIPDEEVFAELKTQAILSAGFNQISSLSEMRELWPVVGRFGKLHTLCVDYYKELLKTPELFRSLYETSKELKSDELQKIALDHYNAESEEFRAEVCGVYEIEENIPKELQHEIG